MEDTVGIVLTRIEGKLDLLTQGQEHLRIDLHNAESRHEALVARVALLEKSSYTEAGEKTGIAKMAKLLYATCALAGFSSLAALGRYLFGGGS